MKSQNMIRMQLMIAGLGAALILPATVKSQEIENATFNDGPNVVAFAQSSPAQASVAALPSSADTSTVEPIKVTTDWPAEQAGFARTQSSVTWQTPVLLMAIGVLALYALAEAKRANRDLRSRRGSYASERRA